MEQVWPKKLIECKLKVNLILGKQYLLEIPQIFWLNSCQDSSKYIYDTNLQIVHLNQILLVDEDPSDILVVVSQHQTNFQTSTCLHFSSEQMSLMWF